MRREEEGDYWRGILVTATLSLSPQALELESFPGVPGPAVPHKAGEVGNLCRIDHMPSHINDQVPGTGPP